MDFFNEQRNATLKQMALDCLYSRKELTHYEYPHEFFHEDEAIGEHFSRCKSIIMDFLLDRIPGLANEHGITLTNTEVDKIAADKLKEIWRSISAEVNKYAEEVRINFISTSGENLSDQEGFD